MQVMNGELLIAENSRHRVNRFDLDGKPLGKWGKRDRTGIEGFAACCNPVNIDIGPGNVLYTAESGIGRIKTYTPGGKFLGVVGYVDTTVFDARQPTRRANLLHPDRGQPWTPAAFT